MHGTRDEHPAVFSARMQHHKDVKKQQPDDDSDKGHKAPDKDSGPDKTNTAKRKATFQRKAKDAAKADEKKPARGVLTVLLPNQ